MIFNISDNLKLLCFRVFSSLLLFLAIKILSMRMSMVAASKEPPMDLKEFINRYLFSPIRDSDKKLAISEQALQVVIRHYLDLLEIRRRLAKAIPKEPSDKFLRQLINVGREASRFKKVIHQNFCCAGDPGGICIGQGGLGKVGWYPPVAALVRTKPRSTAHDTVNRSTQSGPLILTKKQ